MKKLLIAVGLSLVCAMPTQAFFKAKAETVIDDFDGSKTVQIRSGALDCTKALLCPMIGFGWVSTVPDKFAIRAEMLDTFTKQYFNIEKLQISIDGNIQTFEGHNMTSYNHDSYSTVSSRLFILPTEYLDVLKNSQNVKIRLVTDRGNYDGAFTGGKRQSIADKHYRLFLDEMAKHTAQ